MPKHTMTREEQAFLMKTLWESLQSPTWIKDDMISFGKAIFSKKSLKDMDDKVFDSVLPFLTTITEHLGQKLFEKSEALLAAEKSNGSTSESQTAADQAPETTEPPAQTAAEGEGI